MWKSRPSSRTKPVIIGNTTYCVSLLTATISGSNLAFPSTKIPLHGNGAESLQQPVIGARQEVTRHSPQAGKGQASGLLDP